MENVNQNSMLDAGADKELQVPNEKPLFEYQFDLLKSELTLINAIIRQMDDIGKSIKNWAIVVWIASVGWFISTPTLRYYFWITAILPLVFWIVDASFRSVQRKFIFRMDEISEFLNDSRFNQSYKQGRFVDFKILDLRIGWTDLSNYKIFKNALRVMFLFTVAGLYLGLSFLSAMWYLVTFLF